MKMNGKRMLAAMSAIVMCFSFAACGSSDSSSEADSKSSAASSQAEESKAEESKAEESKAEESKAEESTAAPEESTEVSEVSEVEIEVSEAEPEVSEAEPEVSEAEPEVSEAEPEESKAEAAPSADGNTLNGKGYTITFPDNWLEFKAYKDKVNEAMKAEGKTAIMLQPFGSEFAYYCAEDLNIEDGVTYFYTSKPSTMSAYKGHSITEDTFKNALDSSIQSSYKSGTLESTDTIKVGGADALKYVGVIPNNGIDYKTVVIVALSGSTLYQYGFAAPAADFSARSGDLDAILNSVKYTEE